MADALPSRMSKDQSAAADAAHVQSMHRQPQAAAAPVAHDQASDNSPNISALLGNLSGDIYAMSVAAIVKGKRGFQLFQILLGLLFTASLQLGLLMMVWWVMVTPSGDVNSETRLLWTQAGQLQGQVCWIKAVLDQNGLNQTNATVNCAMSWPVNPSDTNHTGNLGVTYATRTSIGPIQCPGSKLQDVPPWEGKSGAKQCLLLYLDQSLFPASLRQGNVVRYSRLSNLTYLGSSTNQSWDQGDCRKVLGNMDPDLAAFGLGMLYSERNLSTQPVPMLNDNMTYRGLHQSKLLADGGWLLWGNTCVPDPFMYTNHSSKAHSRACNFLEQASSHARCIGSVDLKSNNPDISALVVNALAFMALAVFAHDELRRAASLCHVSAAACSCLPEFYAPNEMRNLQTPYMCWGLRLVLLVAPLLQLCVAVLVLLTGGAISLNQEVQISRIQLILNSVALCFILNIDDAIGAMIRPQQTHLACATKIEADVPSLAQHVSWRSVCATSGVRRFLGHAYVAFLGLLLTIEPLLLSPTISALLLLGLLASQEYNSVAKVVVKLATRSTWGSYVLSTNTFMYIVGLNVCRTYPGKVSMAQCMENMANNVGNQAVFFAYGDQLIETFELGAILGKKADYWFTLGYACIVVCIVVLLFYRPLPTVAFRWAPTLLSLQVLAAITTCILLLPMSHYSLATSFIVYVSLGCYLCITWLCMFLIWPTCHKYNVAYITTQQPCCCACGACCGKCCGNSCRNTGDHCSHYISRERCEECCLTCCAC